MLEEFLFFVINNINGTDPSKFLQIGPKFTTIGCKKCLTYSRDNFALGEISGELYGLNSVEEGQYAKCMINNVNMFVETKSNCNHFEEPGEKSTI